jgi:hypothetical protein
LGIHVRDKTLIILATLIIVLNAGHVADHVVRGDFPWPLDAWSVPPIAFVLISNAILGFGLYFYVKGKVGPLFWAIVAGLGIAAAWLGHLSPFTEQTPQYICRAYASPIVGGFAVAWFVALVLVLIMTAIYAEYLWARSPKS